MNLEQTMKYVGNFLSKATAYSVALLITSLALSVHAELQQGKAKVAGIKGSAQYSEGGASWSPLKRGDILGAGAVIQTAANSMVDLYLGDNGPLVRVTEDTTLGLTKLTCEKTGADVVIETELNLTAGRILGTVKKTSDASRYEVKLPVGVASIRGTTYDISATGLARCIKGSFILSYKGPTGGVGNYELGAGQTFLPESQSVVPTPSDYVPGLGALPGEGEAGIGYLPGSEWWPMAPLAPPGQTVSGEQEVDGIIAPNALNPLPDVDGGFEPPVSPTWPYYRPVVTPYK
jgi:hypothetical protein